MNPTEPRDPAVPGPDANSDAAPESNSDAAPDANAAASPPVEITPPAVPFSTKGAFAYYVSISKRYAGSIILMTVLLWAFASLSMLRFGVIALVVDSVEIFKRGEVVAQATTAESVDGGAAGPGSGNTAGNTAGEGEAKSPVDKSGDSATAKFTEYWERFLPETWPAPTRDLHRAEGFWHFLRIMLITLGASSVVVGFCYFFTERIGISVVARMSIDTRKALFDHLTTQSVSYFHDRRSGDLTSRVTNDVEVVQGSLHELYQNLYQQPMMILAAMLVAVTASPLLFAIAAPGLIILIVPVFRAGRRVLRHGRKRQKNLGVLTEALQQLFGGIRIVKAFGMETWERKQFQEKNLAFGRSFRKTLQAKVTGRTVQEILYSLGLTGLLLLGAWLIMRGDLSTGLFSMFALAMVQIYGPLKAASKAMNRMHEAQPAIERVLEILRTHPTVKDREGAREFPGIRQDIRFDDVGFSYRAVASDTGEDGQQRRAVIRGLSLEVSKGQIVALVGSSGAGKSTVVDLLARFYDPQRGAILVDGVDVREYTHLSYLRSIAIVSQDPFLFNTSIIENIRYGKPEATREEIEAAARAANAHEFIVEQPEGYETQIGDRGAKLSGGQRQRLTIARALLKNAPILILDEATSALDSESERSVQKAIDTLMRDRTTFVIAHRLSTITNADIIVVMDEGRIVEQGGHEELLARRGRYYELYSTQNPSAAVARG